MTDKSDSFAAQKLSRRVLDEPTYVVVNASLLCSHTTAHVEAMEKNSRNPQCRLRQFYHRPRLVYEVDALGPPQSLVCGRQTFHDAGRAQSLLRCEVPLVGAGSR